MSASVHKRLVKHAQRTIKTLEAKRDAVTCEAAKAVLQEQIREEKEALLLLSTQ